MLTTVAVILAAGQGKRMQSDLPKILHQVNGRPMIDYSLKAAIAATCEKPVVVVGHKAHLVVEYIGDQAHFVYQEQQLGTGHAVQQAEKLLSSHCKYVLVLSADMPLLTSTTLKYLVDIQKAHSGPMTMVTIIADNPRGFGRVIRNTSGDVQAIIEETMATSEELLVKELNAGVYCFNAAWLWDTLPQIKLSPKGEYYLTDLVAIAVNAQQSVQTLTLSDPNEAMGINTPEHLREAELLIQHKLLHPDKSSHIFSSAN
ncbi:MAG: NTP transferase domain-containing protein [Anaerolineales bacterium]|nr:NTP transferase domain-containing protein [Anaerolineales bacterium]